MVEFRTDPPIFFALFFLFSVGVLCVEFGVGSLVHGRLLHFLRREDPHADLGYIPSLLVCVIIGANNISWLLEWERERDKCDGRSAATATWLGDAMRLMQPTLVVCASSEIRVFNYYRNTRVRPVFAMFLYRSVLYVATTTVIVYVYRHSRVFRA